ncbi:hypothetical protein NC652_013885 [Populus alba x Populus x berolinensis]|nr:hypothetical protein NC652_013885 [Populus alba x Populus x berolinensis]
MWLLTSCVLKVLLSFLVIELLFFQARGEGSIYHGFVLCSCVLEKMSCLSSCKKIALAYSPCQTRRIIKWLAIGLSQSSYRFYSMLATFALKDYRLVAPNRAKSLELSFYTVDDAMLVELQSSKLVEQISEI